MEEEEGRLGETLVSGPAREEGVGVGEEAETVAAPKPQLLGGRVREAQVETDAPQSPLSRALSGKVTVWGHWPGSRWAGAPCQGQNTRTHPGAGWGVYRGTARTPRASPARPVGSGACVASLRSALPAPTQCRAPASPSRPQGSGFLLWSKVGWVGGWSAQRPEPRGSSGAKAAWAPHHRPALPG